MKKRNRLAIVTLTAIASTFVSQAWAQYRAVGNDGIAASPKVRQMLDERKAAAAAQSGDGAYAGYRPVGKDGIAASPKVRQQLAERARQFASAPEK